MLMKKEKKKKRAKKKKSNISAEKKAVEVLGTLLFKRNSVFEKCEVAQQFATLMIIIRNVS